jgi:hypothetical protein
MTMNTDKAYLLGLMIGGGVWGNAEDTFRIKLPYKQWGSYEENPKRAGEISRDIMTVVSPMFRSVYGISVSFDATTSIWNILCDGDTTEIKADLSAYGIECEGELRKNASIGKIVADLADDFMKRRFIAGLADTIGSTNKNHRRFSDDVQIISFELQGFNFDFVCELCRLLYSVGCYPDQILWNHPNFHAANNPYYKQWTKGHKLRVQLDQYASFGAFAFSTKAKSAQENRQLQSRQTDAIPCPDREVRASVSCVHLAEHDRRLPELIREGHYLHNRHICAVMGCEHAPYEAVDSLFSNVGDLINPFPILCRDTLSGIEKIIKDDVLLKNRNYTVSNASVKMLFGIFRENYGKLLYGNDNINVTGYPITEIMQGVAYIIAGNDELNGTRVKGNYLALTERHLNDSPDLCIEIRIPDLLTPLVIVGNGRGVLIGARNPRVYEKLVEISTGNKYKLLARKIAEEDLN